MILRSMIGINVALGGADGVLSAFKLRWQNDQGASVAEDFTVLFSDEDNNITKNPNFFQTGLCRRRAVQML